MIAKYKEQFPTQPASINWYDMTDFYLNSFALEEHVQPVNNTPVYNTWPLAASNGAAKHKNTSPKNDTKKQFGTWSF
jgi:hypothetical protein